MAQATLDEDVEPGLDGGGQNEAPQPKLGKKKLLIFGAGGIAFLILVGVGLYFTGALDHLLGHKQASVQAPPAPLVFFDLPDFLVNLNSSNGRRANFLKLSVALQLQKLEDKERIQAMLPVIIDNFQVYLRELRIDDLRGSDGIYRLREELLARVNAVVAPVKVTDILFREMLVQ